MVTGNVILDTSAQGLQKGINPVHLGLELEAEADATSRLLPLEIDTCPVVTGTPGAGRLGAITLDLSRFTQLAAKGPVSILLLSLGILLPPEQARSGHAVNGAKP